MDSNPLALLFDAHAVFSEHHDERPELYALHPTDHAAVVATMGLTPDGRGGYSRWHARLGWIGPTFVPDGGVARGTVRVWGDATEYAEDRARRGERPAAT